MSDQAYNEDQPADEPKAGSQEEPGAGTQQEPQTPSEELVEADSNLKLQTSNQQDMEVHHHSHTARKKFTHYLWEFLMLFLAVFCGFLAENIREHRVEHAREAQFIKSLVRPAGRCCCNKKQCR